MSVRSWRGRLGISQEELAERAGLHRTYVCDIERGARNVSLKSIEKLAKALEVPLSTLFSSKLEPLEEKADAARADGVDILFVEESHADAERALEILKQGKFANRIQWVRDGAEALDFIFCTGFYERRSPSDGPQVAFLNLKLSKIKGIDVLRRVKSDPRSRSVQVVVMTESADDRDIEASRRLGADAFLVKPLDFRNLNDVIRRLSFPSVV
ncbi:MAG TPA: helix-turn-helix domain-containing protein [Candidatus Paceibacterota bacterium]|nr:helix-turn-helix domain-containing protein [Candidatus Paceibacterota bacterium]